MRQHDTNMKPLLKQVTLIVYDWEGNEPGTLSWVFPSLRAAMRAVKALRNAVKWLIVAGRPKGKTFDLDTLRRQRLVLLEKPA
jgi:hypothetical protein